jgi:hypothetical protein
MGRQFFGYFLVAGDKKVTRLSYAVAGEKLFVQSRSKHI